MENSNQNNTFASNFRVNGIVSISIGLYFLAAAYLIKSSLDGYVLDGYSSGKLSEASIPLFIGMMTVLTLLFSGFTIYFFARHRSRIQKQALWNSPTQQAALRYGMALVIIGIVLFTLKAYGSNEFLVPAFLIGFALHSLWQTGLRKEQLLIPGLCVLLTAVCLVIPSYWYPSLLMLGVAYITRGIAYK